MSGGSEEVESLLHFILNSNFLSSYFSNPDLKKKANNFLGFLLFQKSNIIRVLFC
jgi:hypothetical protein